MRSGQIPPEAEVTFAQFNDAYNAQGAPLHEEIVQAGENGASHTKNTREEVPLLAAINAAAQLLRRNPSTKLGERSIELPPHIAAYRPAHILGTLVNDSIVRQPKDPDIPEITTNVPAIDTCDDAELTFSDTIVELLSVIHAEEARRQEKPAREPDQLLASQIIIGRSGPVILRKYDGRPAGMTLREITLNGIRYPAGFLMRIGVDTDKSLDEYADEGEAMPGELVDAGRITFIGPARPSSFAFDPADRPHLYADTIPRIINFQPNPTYHVERSLPIGVVRWITRQASSISKRDQ